MAKDSDEKPKPKDTWDKLGLLGGPLTAVVALIFTLVYNAKQDAINEEVARNQLVLQRLDIVAKYYSELMNQDKARRDFAIDVIKNAGDDELAERLSLQFDPQRRDRVFAGVAPATSTADTPSGAALRGWAYLGTYEASAKQWRTRYFDFSATTDPERLIGTQQTVSKLTGELNIRERLPSGDAPMPPALAVLVPGQSIYIRSVRNWKNSGYHWAEVDYKPSTPSATK